jgi:hypothetical protein
MKKAQNEQMKTGGEMARVRYQQFISQPKHPLRALTEEEREMACDILFDAFEAESNELEIIDNEEGISSKYLACARRVFLLARIRLMVSCMRGDASLSNYCRDN